MIKNIYSFITYMFAGYVVWKSFQYNGADDPLPWLILLAMSGIYTNLTWHRHSIIQYTLKGLEEIKMELNKKETKS